VSAALVTVAFLFFYTSTPKVPVPNVIGETRATAEQILKNAKLNPELEHSSRDDTCQRGTVIDQSPKKGDRVREDAEVTLTVCVSR